MITSSFAGLIRDVRDYPIPGITFRDITPLLADGPGLEASISSIAGLYDGEVDVVVGIEARGFIFATPVAVRLGVGFVPIRKPNKLPWSTTDVTYDLEYGTDTLEMHTDAVHPGQRVLLVDDVLATGGTAAAAVSLLESAGAEVVAATFLVELPLLGGRNKLPETPVYSSIAFND